MTCQLIELVSRSYIRYAHDVMGAFSNYTHCSSCLLLRALINATQTTSIQWVISPSTTHCNNYLLSSNGIVVYSILLERNRNHDFSTSADLNAEDWIFDLHLFSSELSISLIISGFWFCNDVKQMKKIPNRKIKIAQKHSINGMTRKSIRTDWNLMGKSSVFLRGIFLCYHICLRLKCVM